MTVENVLMCAALAIIELMSVVQIRMMLPMINHVLIYILKLKQQLLQDTNVIFPTPKMQNLVDVTLTRTLTTTAKVTIKIQCLNTMLYAATTAKTFALIFGSPRPTV